MKRRLRSNLEPGSPREAVRRAQWTALGLTDADMQKPKIAVVNSSSELAICFSHLDGIARLVKEEIRAAGGLPFEIRTAAPSDFIIAPGHAGTIQLNCTGNNSSLDAKKLIVTKVSNSIQGTAVDASDEIVDDTDFVFRYRPGPKLYAYRWKTSNLTQGTYQLNADLGDGVVHQINVSLKATP